MGSPRLSRWRVTHAVTLPKNEKKRFSTHHGCCKKQEKGGNPSFSFLTSSFFSFYFPFAVHFAKSCIWHRFPPSTICTIPFLLLFFFFFSFLPRQTRAEGSVSHGTPRFRLHDSGKLTLEKRNVTKTTIALVSPYMLVAPLFLYCFILWFYVCLGPVRVGSGVLGTQSEPLERRRKQKH